MNQETTISNNSGDYQDVICKICGFLNANTLARCQKCGGELK